MQNLRNIINTLELDLIENLLRSFQIYLSSLSSNQPKIQLILSRYRPTGFFQYVADRFQCKIYVFYRGHLAE